MKTSRAVVMGLGSFGGGLGAARYLASAGARVLVTDLRSAPELSESLPGLEGLGVETVLGEHRETDFETADLVVVNPAVRPDNPFVSLARSRGARITSEIELFLEAVRARVVCVTGTQGKSSTCHALHQLLEGSGFRAHLGGNIGRSLLTELEHIEPGDVCVLELSSYQLGALGTDIAARVGCVEAVAVTNVLADHLAVHGSLAAYAAAKRRILELVRPDGLALLPAEDPVTADWQPASRTLRHGAASPRAELRVEGGLFRHGETDLGATRDCHLPGQFQLGNVLLALGLAEALGARPADLARTLPGVRGLEHRLEDLGLRGGRHVHDNGVSTTPDSTEAVLGSLPGGAVVLLGGRSKNLPWDDLAAALARRGDRAVAFGEARREIAAALDERAVPVHQEAEFEHAVERALELAGPGDHVLFSPACSSFDAFPNFRARARTFRAALPARDPAAPGGTHRP